MLEHLTLQAQPVVLWCLRGGMDLHSLRLWMSHSTLAVLQRYLALAGEDVEQAHVAHSPVDRLRNRVSASTPHEQVQGLASVSNPTLARATPSCASPALWQFAHYLRELFLAEGAHELGGDVPQLG